MTERDAIACLLNPDSVVVVGASDDLGKFGGRALNGLIRHGYRGKLYPINPRREAVMGLKAFPTVSAIPGGADVAVVALPAAMLAASVRDCAQAGVRVCIVITGQLAEAGPEGAALQDEIVAIAHAAGMRILGPNCLGLINVPASLALTPSVTMAVEALPRGGVGIVSQSGALMTSMFNRGHDCGVGFSACVSVGNQADIEVGEVFDALVDDPHTKAICLYLEGLRDPGRFAEAARRARAAGKPVVAVKAGRTDAGAKAAASHTAGLAGSYEAFEAACRSLGVHICDDPETSVLCADALLRWGGAGGGRVAVVSGSGGGASVVADRIEGGSMRLARLGPETLALLSRHIPPDNIQGVVDIGGFGQSFVPPIVAEVMEGLLADPDVAMLFYVMTPQPIMAEVADILVEMARRSGKPVLIVLSVGGIADGIRETLRARGFPFHDRVDDALRVAEVLVAHGRAKEPDAPQRPDGMRDARQGVVANFAPGLLTEPEVKRMLAEASAAVTTEILTATPDAAATAAGRIGYPVALKAVARGLVHKSDIGAVRLGLDDEAAVRKAFEEVASAVAAAAPDAAFEGCLVQEMVSGLAEVFVGAKWDDQFGALVLVGCGGIFVEILRDVQTALAPVSVAMAEAMLRDLTLWPLLAGARGRPAADVPALADLIARASWVAADLGPRLVELDLNPVMVRALGEGAVIADGRAVLRDET